MQQVPIALTLANTLYVYTSMKNVDNHPSPL